MIPGKPVLASSERILTRQKSNAASSGDTINLRWESGVFVLPGSANGIAASSRKNEAEAAFLAGLRAKQAKELHISESPKAGNYAPTALANTIECRNFKKAELIEAMKNLLKQGVIASKTYKRNSRVFEELAIVAEVEKEADDTTE